MPEEKKFLKEKESKRGERETIDYIMLLFVTAGFNSQLSQACSDRKKKSKQIW